MLGYTIILENPILLYDYKIQLSYHIIIYN